jgi:hypothetical protein
VSPEVLPPNMRKHVDPAAPVPLRMMAAKSLVPLTPPDMLSALFMLTFDADASVRETAAKTAAGLPDRILSVALRDEGLKPPVLGYFLEVLGGNDTFAEMLLLNPATPDPAVAVVARTGSARLLEIIGENQLRLLRHEDIVRQLCANPNASPALVDRISDFAVRSGLVLADVPQMQQARVRLFGPQAALAPPDPGPTAEEVMRDYKEAVTSEAAAPLEEGKKLNLTQRILKMSIAEKIKLATLGNKEARGILVRDPNKLVALAAIHSPRITDGEIMAQANNKAAHEDVLRSIYASKEWTKEYPVKLALVKNPKVPVAVTMRFLATLRESDVKDLAKNKNVPSGVQVLAKRMMEKKNAPKASK